MDSTTDCYDQPTNNNNKTDVKKKEVSNTKKSLKISHRKKNFRYKPY